MASGKRQSGVSIRSTSGYLGNSEIFDKALAKFAGAYADQTEKDYKAMRKAGRDGRLEVAELE